MVESLKFFFSSLLLILLLEVAGYSQIRLPRLVSDGMILQREMPVKIWGWAGSGEKVELQFRSLSFETIAENDGRWELTLPAQKAGGPFEISIEGSNRINLKNILFGDVFICSGQSNMEYPMSRLADKYSIEIEKCENNSIRQFTVPQKYDYNRANDDYIDGSWVEVNPKTVLRFSAVAYFFAFELYEKYKVPIGIINASYGGSPAEAWLSADALHDFPKYLEQTEKFKNQSLIDEIQGKERKASGEWYENLNNSDQGLQASPKWKDPAFTASSWPTMPIPSYWADHGLGEVNGAFWFRREIDIPDAFTHTRSWIQLGRMVDADSVFINGHFVGTTAYQYPQRKYEIPAGILNPGINCIVIRLISNSGRGGFVSDKPYQILNNKDTFDLKGNWQYQTGCIMPPAPGMTFVQFQPSGLYNSMIAPASNFKIKGVLWYQGESNVGRYQEYQKILSSLISDWRLKRNQQNLPFIIAQLPNFMEANEQPVESNWASFRDAQLKTSQTVQNTILTVNIDLGEWNDIHPQNKKDVGKRFAMAAEELAYNHNKMIALGPVLKSVNIEGNMIKLRFTNCGSGLISKDGGALKQFAIAGSDNKYTWAKAEIKGNQVYVWNDNIKDPVVVRYAWADNPEGANLYSKEGLPASPFCAGK